MQTKVRKFTTDWFSHNLPQWEKFVLPLRNLIPKRLLEVGCFEGRATCWLLDNVMGEDDRIDVIDTFGGSEEHKVMGVDTSDILKKFQNNIGFDPRVEIHIGKSQEILSKRWGDKKGIFDFIYIDGSHLAKNVMVDAIHSWRLLVRGGMLIFDDYEWVNPTGDLPRSSPKIAIDSFLELFADELSVLYLGYQAIIKKL